MSNRNKFYLFILIIIAIILINYGFIYIGYRNYIYEEETEVEKRERTELLKNINFGLYNEDDSLKWDLTAEEITRFTDQKKIDLSDIIVKAQDLTTENNGEKDLYFFDAPGGNYWEQDNKLFIKGPVNIAKKDYHLILGNLRWYQEENIISGNQGIKLETPKFLLKGAEFESNLALDSITISGEETQAQLRWKENEL